MIKPRDNDLLGLRKEGNPNPKLVLLAIDHCDPLTTPSRWHPKLLRTIANPQLVLHPALVPNGPRKSVIILKIQKSPYPVFKKSNLHSAKHDGFWQKKVLQPMFAWRLSEG
jgi:hypothetical protein